MNKRLCRFGLTGPGITKSNTNNRTDIVCWFCDRYCTVYRYTFVLLPDILLGDAKRRGEERRRLGVLLLLLYQQRYPSADFRGYSNDGKYHLYRVYHVCYSIHDAGQNIMNSILFVIIRIKDGDRIKQRDFELDELLNGHKKQMTLDMIGWEYEEIKGFTPLPVAEYPLVSYTEVQGEIRGGWDTAISEEEFLNLP